ncbi:MAG TPA: aquaporin [Candidatus Brocadiia bacterium]|nr:aquaporin [Planctomycetota bacterium]MDO8093749.1 aquaporin [Candidatus Brocadiales bacterium]
MDAYKKYFSEFLGTFILIFVGSGAVCANYLLTKAGQPGLGLLGIALSYGFAVVAIVYALSYISGTHINPATTISFWVTKRIDGGTALMYILFQLAGAASAGFLIKTMFPEAIAINFGAFSPAPGVSSIQAILMEALLSFLLVFTVYATVVDKRAAGALAGLAIGLVVVFDVVVGATVSGGAVTPSIAFGPAIASGNFANHQVYWIGHCLGAIVAGLVYDLVFAEKEVVDEELLRMHEEIAKASKGEAAKPRRGRAKA